MHSYKFHSVSVTNQFYKNTCKVFEAIIKTKEIVAFVINECILTNFFLLELMIAFIAIREKQSKCITHLKEIVPNLKIYCLHSHKFLSVWVINVFYINTCKTVEAIINVKKIVAFEILTACILTIFFLLELLVFFIKMHVKL